MKKILTLLLFLSVLTLPAIAKDTIKQEQVSKTINNTKFDKNTIVTYKTFQISAVDPKKTTKKPNQLIIYTPLYGKTTNTDSKGFEAVIVNNRVTKLNQSNSYIPKNGYVVSGHGKAKQFLTDNLFEGADVSVNTKTSEFKVKTTPENYIYLANYKLQKVKDILKNAGDKNINKEDMEFYIERSESILRNAKKAAQFEDYDNALRLANDSITYSDNALYFSLLYDPNEFKGIWVFPYQKNKEEVEQAFEITRHLRVQNIFIEGFYNGTTIYKSDVAKKYGLSEQNRYYQGFDPLAYWLKLAQEEEKNVYVVFNTFNLGSIPKSTLKTSIVKIHPDWINVPKNKFYKQTKYYLDPANQKVHNFLIELIDEVSRKYKIAGINLTGLKYPDNYGYTKLAKQEFQTIYHQNLNSVKDNDLRWKVYKSNNITAFVNRILNKEKFNSKMQITINVYPTYTQGMNKWNVNENVAICPVLTSTDDDFANDALSELKTIFPKTKIYPIYLEPYLEEKPRKLFEQIAIARKNDIHGLILYNTDYISREYDKALMLSIFNTRLKHKLDSSNLIDINSKPEETKDNNGTQIKH